MSKVAAPSSTAVTAPETVTTEAEATKELTSLPRNASLTRLASIGRRRRSSLSSQGSSSRRMIRKRTDSAASASSLTAEDGGTSTMLLNSTAMLILFFVLLLVGLQMRDDKRVLHVFRDAFRKPDAAADSGSKWWTPSETAQPVSGTICIYSGSTCSQRMTKPGTLVSCHSHLDDGVCLNFPSAGAVFTCVANEKVNLYSAAGCASTFAQAQFVGCVDMNVNTYFLLCCLNDESNDSQEPGTCEHAAAVVLDTEQDSTQSKHHLGMIMDDTGEAAEKVLELKKVENEEALETVSNQDQPAGADFDKHTHVAIDVSGNLEMVDASTSKKTGEKNKDER